MNNIEIAKMVDKYVKKDLANLPFDKGLPLIRNKAWEIAEKNGLDGATVLQIYFDWRMNK